MSKPRRRTIRVPSKRYRPTRAELCEPVKIDTGELSFEQAVQRLMRPVDVKEFSVDEHRAKQHEDE